MSTAKSSVARSAHSAPAHAAELRGWYPPVKRLWDVVLASVGLLLASPLWTAISLAIVLESGMPVFYSRQVAGWRGKPFRVLKFRSMRKDNTVRADLDPKHDPRITRVGRLLRPTALDELPSLLHILRGEMSFVGPRVLLRKVEDPADPDFGRESATLPRGEFRLLVRPGLTGLAQMYGPKNLPYRHKFRYDALYIRKMSLSLDIKLVAMSFLRTFARRWEQVQTRRLQ